MKKITILFLAVISNLSFADRPIKSTEAYTIGKHTFQVEFGFDMVKSQDLFSAMIPVVFSFGLSDQSDLIFGSSFASPENSSGFISPQNFDIGLKQQVYNFDAVNFSFNAGITSGELEHKFSINSAYIYLLSSIEYESVILHLNAGYNQNWETDVHRHTWFTSAGGELPISDRFSLAADIGIARDPSVEQTELHSFGLLGLTYGLTENLVLDTGIMFTNQSDTKLNLITAGFTLVL